jgi:hypothetical protein
MENAAKKRAGTRRASDKTTPVSGLAKTGSGKSAEKSASSDLTAIQISVADDYLAHFDDVLGRVKKLGFKLEQELPDIGVMVGQMPAERVGELGGVEGVGYFERPRSFQMPPPDSEVQ